MGCVDSSEDFVIDSLHPVRVIRNSSNTPTDNTNANRRTHSRSGRSVQGRRLENENRGSMKDLPKCHKRRLVTKYKVKDIMSLSSINQNENGCGTDTDEIIHEINEKELAYHQKHHETKKKNEMVFYNCPICTDSYNRILACEKCENCVCHKCFLTYEKKTENNFRCYFCGDYFSIFRDYEKEPKKYFDTSADRFYFSQKQIINNEDDKENINNNVYS